MALLSAEHLAGPGYIILNIIRGLNIITLSSVVASSVVMLVKTFIISKVGPAFTILPIQELTDVVLLLRRHQPRRDRLRWQ